MEASLHISWIQSSDFIGRRTNIFLLQGRKYSYHQKQILLSKKMKYFSGRRIYISLKAEQIYFCGNVENIIFSRIPYSRCSCCSDYQYPSIHRFLTYKSIATSMHSIHLFSSCLVELLNVGLNDEVVQILLLITCIYESLSNCFYNIPFVCLR